MHRRLAAWGLLLSLQGPSLGRAEPLPEDAAGRRAIRGTPVAAANESEELRELRRFEEASFPRRPLFVPAPPGDVIAEEGAEPSPPAPRPSAENPPPELGTPGLRRPADPPPSSGVPWLSTLKLPDLPVRWDPRLVRYLEFYRNDRRGRAIMASWLRKQGRYRALIEDALQRHKLPRALLYVAMIESGYEPLDKSSAGAAGLWQFMPDGGRIYGLRIDHWVDERRHPERATEAVMRYFADLEARFGSWHLALAAFNAGYGAVLKAIGKYNTNDFWELCRHEDGLPWETTLYVPKALAAAIVGENREAFGFGDLPADPPYAYDRVLVPTSTSLAALAAAAGVPSEQVVALNPELRRGRTPPQPWEARLPAGTGPRYAESFARHREQLGEHLVRFGERLDDIARAYGAQSRERRRLNGLEDRSEVRPGLTMVVPAGRAPLPPPPEEEIAIVAVPDKDQAIPARKRVFYRVLPGDELQDIAGFFKVSPGDLARWNHLDGEARLSTRQVLQLFVPEGFDTSGAALLDPARVRVVTLGSEEFFDLVEARRGRRRVTYSVRAGETLKQIGARFGLTAGDVERINRLGRHGELKAGQKLTVYVAMTAAERAEAQKRLTSPPTPASLPAATDEEDGVAQALERSPDGADGGGGKLNEEEPTPTTAQPPPPPETPGALPSRRDDS